jgi:hypothetical protein
VRKWNPGYFKQTHKFGIELPNTLKEALELDKKIVIPSELLPLPRK